MKIYGKPATKETEEEEITRTVEWENQKLHKLLGSYHGAYWLALFIAGIELLETHP